MNSDETSLAAHIVKLAKGSGMPCIQFFCEGHPGSITRLNVMDAPRRFVSPLYSVDSQFTLFAPESFAGDYDYCGELSQMNGTLESVSRALEMIRRLLGLAPRLVLCVIDALQRLDQPAVRVYIEELLTILQGFSGNKVFKLLLTTRGFFPAGAKLNATDRLVYSRLPRKQQGGR